MTDTPIPDPASEGLSRVLMTGLLGIMLTLALAALIISRFDVPVFMGWVGLFFLAATPTQIVLGLLWNNELPASVGKLSQPFKGLALTAITICAGLLIGLVANYTVGGGLGPTPMLTQYMIFSVVVALWVIPIWHAWPFSALSKNPLIVGVLSLIGFYVIAFILWRVFFNYDALIGAPFYSEGHAPSGLFDMWTAMVFAVTTGAVVVMHVVFDFWPMDKISFGKAQPVRGLISTVYIIALSFLVHWVFLGLLKMEPVDYMVRVPVSLIFGVFLTTNMMQNKLFSSLKQPVRGLALCVPVIISAIAMYCLYEYASALHAGAALPSGPENLWQRELWIATAMLSITFPLIIIVSGFFELWPLSRRKK